VLPIEQACYWLAQRAPRDGHPLEGAAETEIAVVGAGLTGLWTALFLKELAPALDVTVVEQGLAAHGASGRNAGMLSETVDHSHGLAIEHFGEPEARRLARLGEDNVLELVAFLEQEGIRCDYEPTGRLMVALTQGQLDDARRAVEIATRLGLDSFRYLDRPAVRSELDSPLYLGGVWVTGGGILDPVKLVDGLREAAERRGVRVYERSRVTALEQRGAGARLHTEGGSLDARRVVLATSAYTHHLLPEITRRFIPLYDYVLVSEPLSAAQRAAIGWARRQGVTDGRAFFNYYRLTADDRILWGTS
jgi:glycine/D-amino acid oxidase-like deaminating enzyme